MRWMVLYTLPNVKPIASGKQPHSFCPEGISSRRQGSTWPTVFSCCCLTPYKHIWFYKNEVTDLQHTLPSAYKRRVDPQLGCSSRLFPSTGIGLDLFCPLCSKPKHREAEVCSKKRAYSQSSQDRAGDEKKEEQISNSYSGR